MITLAVLGGAGLASTVGIGGLAFLRRRSRELPMPDDVVWMEESVLQDFLHNEYIRNVESAERTASPAAERSVSSGAADVRPSRNAGDPSTVTSSLVSPSLTTPSVVTPTLAAPSLTTTSLAVEVASDNGERVIPSMAGGATAVAGPPTDLADEGWARDPQGCHEWRYFDSDGWSDFVLDGDNVDTDPILAPSLQV